MNRESLIRYLRDAAEKLENDSFEVDKSEASLYYDPERYELKVHIKLTPASKEGQTNQFNKEQAIKILKYSELSMFRVSGDFPYVLSILYNGKWREVRSSSVVNAFTTYRIKAKPDSIENRSMLIDMVIGGAYLSACGDFVIVTLNGN